MIDKKYTILLSVGILLFATAVFLHPLGSPSIAISRSQFLNTVDDKGIKLALKMNSIYSCNHFGDFHGFMCDSQKIGPYYPIEYNRITRLHSRAVMNLIPLEGSGVNPKSLKRLDFETGDLSQWTNSTNKVPTSQNNCAQYDYPGTDNRLDVVSSNTYPPATSKYSLQVTLTANAKIINGTNGTRAELEYCKSKSNVTWFNNGTDQWYHWYTMFSPSEFELPGPNVTHPWHVWTQWHTGDNGTYNYGVPLEFALDGNVLNLHVLGHYFDCIHCYKENITCGYLWTTPLKKGVWYDVLLHVKWSTRTDGLVEGRIKLIGINGTNEVDQIQTYHGNTLNNLTNATTDGRS